MPAPIAKPPIEWLKKPQLMKLKVEGFERPHVEVLNRALQSLRDEVERFGRQTLEFLSGRGKANDGGVKPSHPANGKYVGPVTIDNAAYTDVRHDLGYVPSGYKVVKWYKTTPWGVGQTGQIVVDENHTDNHAIIKLQAFNFDVPVQVMLWIW